MKVVFLDVDGVLNTSETFKNGYNYFKNNGKKLLEIDLNRLEYLKRIIDETDSNIVLSSTWRRFFKRENNKIVPINEKGKLFNELLNSYGIELYDILDNNLVNEEREKLILNWIYNNDVDSFVIIDDEPSLFNDLYDRLIKTSNMEKNQLLTNMDDCYGLCEFHIEIAKGMLKNKEKIKKFE